ncbi:carbonyl reductase (NADPH-dependent) [Sugiyamaella lignohabitans]|uniref:Carbonyl reductase (NADPH-dependent) n=1 Tax=Sugiyamaella lignohabitans TaxID=796027 RepID=A0A167C177_9ASCO|nr:carbonyl reductase (NADPH-dependent) [Sugiyamaella lignohabitans]ANB11092.1 carbonyl reductase (NADPH-dependent) [Sugiyamaella lignohabitans]
MVKVLLTGGSGFIAAHVLDILIEKGYEVVTTVRSQQKGQKILDAHPKVSKDKLSYVIVEDIAQPGAFDEAVKSEPGFDAVIHTASPFHFNVVDPVKDLLDPAVNGTVGILKAIKAHAPTVKRVAITSSFASIINASQHPETYSEKDWNPVTWEQATDPKDPATTYRGSKTFAEKAAWDFVEKEKPNFTITTLCPPLVLGPIVHYLNSLDAINTSNARVRDFIQGKYKGQSELPPTGTFIWVDVRDLALSHVLAIEKSEAENQRFFITAGYFSNKKIVEAIRKSHPELSDKLPLSSAKDDTPEGVYGYDNSKSIKLLGLKYSPFDAAIKDTVDSLLEVGA